MHRISRVYWVHIYMKIPYKDEQVIRFESVENYQGLNYDIVLMASEPFSVIMWFRWLILDIHILGVKS